MLSNPRWHKRVAQRLERWIFLYNVTTGLYMLDWWECCIFNAVFLLFFAVARYNSGHYLQCIATACLLGRGGGNRRKRPSAIAEPLDDELGFVRLARNEQNSRLSGLGYVVIIAYQTHSDEFAFAAHGLEALQQHNEQ